MYHPLGTKSKEVKPKLLFLKEGEDPDEKERKAEEEFNCQQKFEKWFDKEMSGAQKADTLS
jgi:hypothetical protein